MAHCSTFKRGRLSAEIFLLNEGLRPGQGYRGIVPLKLRCLASSRGFFRAFLIFISTLFQKKGDAGESIAFVVHVMKLLTIE
jgi:hypothetical protein